MGYVGAVQRVGTAIRWLRRRTRTHRTGVPILMYHRVQEETTDPWDLCVTPTHFSEHMEHLSRHFSPLNLGDLVARLAAGRLPERAVVVTFDDGYADNLWNAKPILERWGVPATIFVASGYTIHAREFWWDELYRLTLQPGTLPGTVVLSFAGRVYQWALGGSAEYTEEDHRRHRTWKVQKDATNPTPRHALYRSVYDLLHPLPEPAQRRILDQLTAQVSNPSEVRRSGRALSPDELISLKDGGLVDIGAHTVWHPVLSALPADDQNEEITRGRVELEELLGSGIPNFSYPHGRFNDDTVSLVKRCGFVSACTSRSGLVYADSDPFRLPRLETGNWNGKEFARRMAAFAKS